jgi:hypothetical protein
MWNLILRKIKIMGMLGILSLQNHLLFILTIIKCILRINRFHRLRKEEERIAEKTKLVYSKDIKNFQLFLVVLLVMELHEVLNTDIIIYYIYIYLEIFLLYKFLDMFK